LQRGLKNPRFFFAQMPKREFFLDHPRRQGDFAELQFMTRATELGLTVSKPWGETSSYDFAVEHGGRFVRVQVKSTRRREGGSYACQIKPCEAGRRYSEREVDYIAAYVIPEDVWYILPVRVTQRLWGRIWLSPNKPRHKYERYLEAWEQLGGKKKGSSEPRHEATQK
jgi:hypothetical protein